MRKSLVFHPVLLLLLAAGPLGLAQSPAPAKQDDTMELMDLLELMNTPVVSASKTAEKLSEAPATMIVVSKKDIERRGYTKFIEILDDLPGFDNMLTYGDTFFKSYARGYRNTIGDSMLVLVDGRVFNHLWFNNQDHVLMAFPLSNIERVEVVYGPASAMYGANAFMGVINVITSPGTPGSTSLNANLMGGSFDQKGVDIAWRQNQGNWGYSLALRRYDGNIDDRTTDNYEYTKAKYFQPIQGRSIFGNLTNLFDAKATSPWHTTAADFRVWAGKFEFGMEFLTLRSGYGLHMPWDKYIPSSSTWERPEWSFHAKFTHDFSDTFTTSATARYRQSGTSNECLDYEVYWDKGSKSFLTNPQHWAVTTSSMDFNQDFQWNALKALSFNWGYVLSQEVQQKGYTYSNPSWKAYPTATYNPIFTPVHPIAELSDSAHTAILRRGFYLQSKWRIDDNQSVLIGVRDDWHIAFKEAVTLRGGYVGNWSGWGLKALYGQAYQEPNPRQLFGGWAGSGSSPSLKPQRSWTAELGLSYTASRWSLLADFYNIKNTNMILTVPGGAKNVGYMDVQGLDLHGQLLFPGVLGKELRLWGYLSQTFKATAGPYNNAVNVLDSDDVADIAKSKIFLGATALFTDQMSLTLKGRSISKRSTVSTNPAKEVDGYATFEAYFQYSDLLAKGLSLGLKVTNLADKHYFEPGLRNGDAGLTPATFNAEGNYVGSKGYYNSLLPQAGRGFELVVRYRF